MLGPISLVAFFLLTVMLAQWLLLLAVRKVARDRFVLVTFIATGWLGGSALLAISGALRFDGSLPPALLQLMVAGLMAAFAFAATPLAGRIAGAAPLSLLVGLQTFRIMEGLVLYWGFREGFVPWQLTWQGYNWDVLAGMGALLIGRVGRRHGSSRALLWIWNTVGVLLLVNLAFVTVFSMPTPAQAFPESPGAHFLVRVPYVWLPVFLMPAALFGHLLVFRRLVAERVQGQAPIAVAAAATH